MMHVLQVSLEAVMQRLVSKADPTLLPPATPATAAAWCKVGRGVVWVEQVLETHT